MQEEVVTHLQPLVQGFHHQGEQTRQELRQELSANQSRVEVELSEVARNLQQALPPPDLLHRLAKVPPELETLMQRLNALEIRPPVLIQNPVQKPSTQPDYNWMNEALQQLAHRCDVIEGSSRQLEQKFSDERATTLGTLQQQTEGVKRLAGVVGCVHYRSLSRISFDCCACVSVLP